MVDVIIVGGGVAALSSALSLHQIGRSVKVLERESHIGGNLRGLNTLFPTFSSAAELLDELLARVAATSIEVVVNCEVVAISPSSVTTSRGETLECRCVILASGFTPFDARLKEEYGYGIYPNVYTALEVEQMFKEGTLPSGEAAPKRIALLHCVGSRDEKVCQGHCSKVCCVTGVKQAIELKRHYPQSEVYNFYMDIRMFGAGYEELYREAQIDYNIHFVRGRISEAAPTHEGKIQIKAEDTLTASPLRMSVDMMILLIGMRANDSNTTFATQAGLQQARSRFMRSRDSYLGNTLSNREGIFYAGAVTGAKNIQESIDEGAHVALEVARYLNRTNK